VDLRATNNKLRVRSARILRQLCGLDEAAARQCLADAGGELKVAILMARRGVGCDEALALLERNQGVLRRALEDGSTVAKSRRDARG